MADLMMQDMKGEVWQGGFGRGGFLMCDDAELCLSLNALGIRV